MASCDGDFGLLRDGAQSQPPPPSSSAAPFASSAHRYVSKAAIHLPTRAASTLAALASPKKAAAGGGGCGSGSGDDDEEYGDEGAFHEHHCFPGDSDPFAPDDGTVGGNPDRKSRGVPASASQHPHLPPMRHDREDLSDGESPYGYSSAALKKARSMSASGDFRKDREEWSDTAIGSLLDAYTERFEQLNRGNLRGRDWEDVAAIVSERCDMQKAGKSVEQCKNKIDNLKKRYKVECQRLSSGGLTVSHWPWFKKMEQIVPNSSSSSKAGTDDERSVAPLGSGTVARQQIKRYSAPSSGPVNISNNSKLTSQTPRWKRVLLKISGVALAGSAPQNVDPKLIMLIAREIQLASRLGVEVAIVVGGRNIFCGDSWVAATGIDRAATYQIGMMASVMNAVLLQASLEKIGVETRVQTALMMQEIAEPYIRQRAIRHLEKRRVVIFGGIGAGLETPLFTTDTAAALKATEINADAVLKGTTVDGVYSCHARNNSNVPYEHISYRELVSRGFTGIDMTAVTFCEENNIPVLLFNLLEPGNISRALCGDQIGTLVDHSGRIS